MESQTKAELQAKQKRIMLGLHRRRSRRRSSRRSRRSIFSQMTKWVRELALLHCTRTMIITQMYVEEEPYLDQSRQPRGRRKEMVRQKMLPSRHQPV